MEPWSQRFLPVRTFQIQTKELLHQLQIHLPVWQNSSQNPADRTLPVNGRLWHPHHGNKVQSGNIYQIRIPSEAACTAVVPVAVHKIFPWIFWTVRYNLLHPLEKMRTGSVSVTPEIPYLSFSHADKKSLWNGKWYYLLLSGFSDPDTDISDVHLRVPHSCWSLLQTEAGNILLRVPSLPLHPARWFRSGSLDCRFPHLSFRSDLPR